MRFWIDKEQESQPSGVWQDSYVFSINRKNIAQYLQILQTFGIEWIVWRLMRYMKIYSL